MKRPLMIHLEKTPALHTSPTTLTKCEELHPLHNPLSGGIQQTPNPSNSEVKGVHSTGNGNSKV